MAVIYALCCPILGDTRYIGKANDLPQRIKSHYSAARRGAATPVYCWIRSLWDKGLEPNAVLIEDAGPNWQGAERKHIASARATAERLLNVADGGDQPCMSGATEAKKRMAALKRNLVGSIKAGYCSDALKDRIRAAAQRDPVNFASFLRHL